MDADAIAELVDALREKGVRFAPGLSDKDVRRSVYQTDTISYGHNLADYLRNEFKLPRTESSTGPRSIRFWSDFVYCDAYSSVLSLAMVGRV